MMRLRRIRGLARRIAPVAVAVAVGAVAGVVLALAVPEPSASPAARAPASSPADPALARVLVSLDRAWVRHRAALRRARTPSEQAMLADRLADDHLEALLALRGRGGAPLGDRLADTWHAYESLQEAATDGSATRYGEARMAVQAAEAPLTRAVDDALRPQVARVAAPIAGSRAGALGSAGLLDWALIVAALGAGLVTGLVRPAGRSPAAAAPPPLLLVAGEVTERRGGDDRADEPVANRHAGGGEGERLDATVARVGGALDEATLLEPVGQEGHVGRVAVQPLGERATRQRAVRGIELSDGVGERPLRARALQPAGAVPLQRVVQVEDAACQGDGQLLGGDHVRCRRTKDPEIYRRIWELREVDGFLWTQISERTGIPEPTLATIRKAAVADGRAIKEPNGRVTWLPPADE